MHQIVILRDIQYIDRGEYTAMLTADVASVATAIGTVAAGGRDRGVELNQMTAVSPVEPKIDRQVSLHYSRGGYALSDF